jgi:peptidoglycan hydrolase-like protein with peptidoglycan-binding domain
MGFGRHARDNVKAFQRHVGLTVDGQYGSDTHGKLVPLFDDYSRWLYAHQTMPSAPSPTLLGPDHEKIGRLMHQLWGFYAQRPWAYNAVRPFKLYRSGEAVTEAFDCSWLATEVYFAAGLPDPNGFGYQGGAGSTETLRAHGTPVTEAQPGDLVFYGFFGNRDDPAHVAMASGNGKVIGFGSKNGPWLTEIDMRPIRTIHRYI